MKPTNKNRKNMKPTLQNKKNKLAMHAELVYTKLKKIEIELGEGNFDNYHVYLQLATKQALDYLLEMAAFYGKTDLVKEAVERGANGNVARCAAIQMACVNGHLDIIKYLAESGTLNSLPENSLLIGAVQSNQLEIMKYLLSDQNIFGVKLCDIHTDHDCALRMAVDGGYLDMVRLLVELGADVNVFGGYLLTVAVNKDYSEIVKYLLDNGLDKKYVPDAIKRADEY